MLKIVKHLWTIFLSYFAKMFYTKVNQGNCEPSAPTHTDDTVVEVVSIAEISKSKTLAKEHKAKISAANKGKHFSEEHKAKISKANKGKHKAGIPLTEEHKAKISSALKGKVRPPMSEETKAKISAALKELWVVNNQLLNK